MYVIASHMFTKDHFKTIPKLTWNQKLDKWRKVKKWCEQKRLEKCSVGLKYFFHIN